MTYRITEKMIERKIAYLNEITGNPAEPYTRGEDGSFAANVGNYHRSDAYGGVSLEQMVGPGGGVHDVFSCGHVPKRELFDRICAMIIGLETVTPTHQSIKRPY